MKTQQQVDHLIPIDFTNPVQLPVSHTWFPSASSSTTESVPVIDLDDPHAADRIRMASENWGVFLVTSHGIPEAVLGQTENQIRRFFDLPLEDKLRALRSPDNNIGYGIAQVSRFNKSLLWSEGFTIVGSPLEHACRVWPQAQDYSAFCAAIEDYQEQMMGLGKRIVSLMFKSLGLSREDVDWFEPNGSHKSTHAILQLNSYPICPNPTSAMGLSDHTDASLVTLVYQSNTSKGLQVHGPNHNLVDIEPISNAIVVVVGDLMQIASNGLFKSVLHRAVVSKAHHRISAAYLFGPNKDAKITPPLKLIKGGDFPKYRTISWKEYIDVKALNFEKGVEEVRLNSLAENTNALTSCNEAPIASKPETIKV